MTGEIHGTAAQGFDQAAEVYAAARPGYPSKAVDWLVERLVLGPQARVLDLAAGTGKLTQELIERGIDCVAVEPVEGMRAELAKRLPDVEVLDGTAEAIPLDEESVDAVTVAQALHWFAFDAALREIHRVLKPRARLALLWNLRDDRIDWVHRVTEIIDPWAEGTGVGIPRHRDRAWQPSIDGSPLFSKEANVAVPHDQQMTVDGLVGRIASTSFIAVLPEKDQARVLGEIRDLAATHPDLAGRKQISFPYICEIDVYVRG